MDDFKQFLNKTLLFINHLKEEERRGQGQPDTSRQCGKRHTLWESGDYWFGFAVFEMCQKEWVQGFRNSVHFIFDFFLTCISICSFVCNFSCIHFFFHLLQFFSCQGAQMLVCIRMSVYGWILHVSQRLVCPLSASGTYSFFCLFPFNIYCVFATTFAALFIMVRFSTLGHATQQTKSLR